MLYAHAAVGWEGIDINGARYDDNGNIATCPYCGKTKGRGENMCNGCINYME